MPRNPNCNLCPLSESTTNVCIWGIGPPQSPIMLIGEAPGRAEAKTGKPFQGDAGKLLHREAAAAGLDLSEAWITNVAKCRPPENRTPTPKELKACRPYLEEEIKVVNPKFILLMGATALKFIRKSGITEQRGRVFEVGGRSYMPCFHPAAALRDPGRLPALREDLKRFAKLVEGNLDREENIHWQIITPENFDGFAEELRASKRFSFDCETTGLFPHSPDFKVNTVSFTLDTLRTWVLPIEKNEDKRWSYQAIKAIHRISCNKFTVGHNGKFDVICLLKACGVLFTTSFDTMLASHTFDENSPHDLKFLARVHLGAPDWDDMTVKEKQGNTDLNRLCKYNALDSYWTYRLYEFYADKFKRTFKLRRLFNKLVMPAARIFEEIDTEGQWINLERFAKTKAELQIKIAESRRQLDRMAGSKRKINWDSPTQVGEILFGKLKLPVIHKTSKGKPSTDEAALLELKGSHPIADLLIEYRGHQKNLSTYIVGWEKLMIDEYLYLSTKLHGTVTGRYSSRLHQVPRDGTIRNLISAPEDEGWTFVCADFSQIELRLIAHDSGDPRMKLVFQTGGDIHRETYYWMMGTGKEPTKEERKHAKPVNFGYSFGMGWPKFQKYAFEKYGLRFSNQESMEFRERFFSVYSKLRDWHDRVRKRVREDGYIEYLSGRLRRLPGVYSQDPEVRGEAERQAINSRIQGFGSGDLKAMAMIGIREQIPREDLRLRGEVHDSLLMWVRTTKLERILPQVKCIMENPPLFKEFRIELSVPLVADIEVGTWGAGKPWKSG